ncbi:phosphatidylinositol-glycan biosynthesis class W protein-like isoform X2 [Corticium candelabrum]|uniref:phosphatidylinositol-glycan biosynthesis class W protein-like isoform X2 n=1 Tax=Corticium candelabrum TaxID=121492 RepID=UPI002E26E347|nr:phosphatidylinositol-glycan biosynthesis class W protein-like isoform X2 [Corticium candelabrum]
MNDWNLAHERFVSNWNGTSLFEVSSVISVAPASVLLYRSFLTVWGPSKGYTFIVEFILIMLPLLSAMTFASDFSLHLIIILIILSAFLLKQSSCNTDKHPSSWQLIEFPDKLPFISGYRAYINISTAVAILAVDFNIFPRRFAKTETYGVSVMDVGVGAYIVANGIVSVEARRHHNLHVVNHVVGTCYGSIVLIALGIARLIVVKVSNYHEHVSEYGRHWNFFFTLAVVKFVSAIFVPLIPRSVPFSAALMGGLIMGLYQYGLSVCGLKDYLLFGFHGNGSRSNVVDANREGLLSCVGYLAIYLFSVELGRVVFRRRKTVKEWIYFCLSLLTFDILCWFLLSLATQHVDAVSRRMANLTYVLWQVAYNTFALICFLSLDILFLIIEFNHKTSTSLLSCGVLIEAIGQHQLVYFLSANLLTGLINKMIFTLAASSLVAFIILSVYLILLSLLVLVIKQKGITTKVW